MTPPEKERQNHLWKTNGIWIRGYVHEAAIVLLICAIFSAYALRSKPVMNFLVSGTIFVVAIVIELISRYLVPTLYGMTTKGEEEYTPSHYPKSKKDIQKMTENLPLPGDIWTVTTEKDWIDITLNIEEPTGFKKMILLEGKHKYQELDMKWDSESKRKRYGRFRETWTVITEEGEEKTVDTLELSNYMHEWLASLGYSKIS